MNKEIILFTGWGATCDVWKLIIPAISECYQANCHAPSWQAENTMHTGLKNFDQYIDQLAASINKSVFVLAWSMGGLLAIALATRHPNLVKNICFISSVPTFVAEHDANAGINFDWYQTFQHHYEQQPIKTLQRFLKLQVQGDAFAKSTLRELKNICPFEEYNLAECGVGLELLKKINYQAELSHLSCQICFIHGVEDAVVKVESARHFATLCQAPLHLIEHAGHVPHLSHPNEVLAAMEGHFEM